MTTENIRLVGMDLTTSTRRLMLQVDSGFPLSTRPTFALEMPPHAMLNLKVGDALTVSPQSSLVEAVGGGVLPSGSGSFTFRPGAAPDPANNIYDTWAALLVAHAANANERIIYFNNSAGVITIPVGVVDFLSRTRLLPAAGMVLPVPITLAAGAALTNPAFVSVSLRWQA